MRKLIFINLSIIYSSSLHAQDQLKPYLEKIEQEERIRKKNQLIEQENATKIIKNRDMENVNVPAIDIRKISENGGNKDSENNKKREKKSKEKNYNEEYYEDLYSKNLDKYRKIEKSKPFIKNGVMYFVYDIGTPILICSMTQVCDLQFEAGENITNIQIGDSTRWIINVKNPSDSQAEPHIFIKPIADKIKTNMIILTDKRQYNINIKSEKKKFFNKVAFYYPQNENKLSTIFNEIPENSKYQYYIRGDKTNWTPTEIRTDGKKTYIKLSEKFKYSPDLPTIYSIDSSGSNIQLNNRMYKDWIIVDVMVDQGELKSGVGIYQSKVLFTRKGTVGIITKLFNKD